MCSYICSDVFWKVLCPFVVQTKSGPQFIGLLVAVPHLLFTKSNKIKAIYDIFFRVEGLSNLMGLASTVSEIHHYLSPVIF